MTSDNYRQTKKMSPLAKAAIILPCVAAGVYAGHTTIKADRLEKEYEQQQTKLSQVYGVLGKERARAEQLKSKQAVLEKRVKELEEHLEIGDRGMVKSLRLNDYVDICIGDEREPGICGFMHKNKLKRALCGQTSPPQRYRGSR